MNKSEKFWNKLSETYDKRAKDKAFELILQKTPQYLTPDDIVLDFACATGLYSIAFANRVKEIQAFDTSSDMIAVAKRNADKNGSNNILFSETDIYDKKYPEASFDIVLAFNILLYFEDPQEVLTRISKLLKPGGIMITATACLKEKRTVIGVMSRGFIYILKKLRVLPYLRFITIKELEKSMTDANFNLIESAIIMEKPATESFIVAQKRA